jgi:hypothetical protein
VRWAVGFVDLEPQWICFGCLDELQRDARDYGYKAVWAVEILEEQVATDAVLSTAAVKRGRGGVAV